MPLQAPNLDDRRFADLFNEAKSLIPRYAPEWTDHNESDPGITFLELDAWLHETLLFRLNQLPERHYIKFLQLLGIDHKKLTYRFNGRDTRLTDVYGVPIPQIVG